MKHIKLFENWGINKGVESYAKEYFDKIKNDDKTEYRFEYSNEKGNFNFDLRIGDSGENTKGYFTYINDDGEDLRINLTDRNDYSTLLHELKHLDRYIRVNKKVGSVRKLKQWSEQLEHNNLKTIFYLLDPDEFEARLHGYYSDIDKYLSENLPEDTEKSIVLKYIRFYMSGHKDVSHTLYTRKREIKVENFADKDYLKRLFTALIEGVPVKKYSLKYLKDKIKTIVGMNKFDNEYYEKTIRYINKILNKNKDKFNRKLNRMIYGLVDKYGV